MEQVHNDDIKAWSSIHSTRTYGTTLLPGYKILCELMFDTNNKFFILLCFLSVN
jgi:hypothetical protein